MVTFYKHIDEPYFAVIMPHGGDPDFEEKKRTIVEVGERYGYTPCFPVFTDGVMFSIDDTLEKFRHAWFIIVDLSYERPSCYYELGIAEALGRKIFAFALKGTIIHQTTHRGDVQFYDTLDHYRELLLKTLNHASLE